jgi:hypothetical protein
LLWLDQREDALWEESNVEHDRIWQRDQAKSNVRKTTARAVKEFVGMEVEDPRWPQFKAKRCLRNPGRFTLLGDSRPVLSAKCPHADY